MSETTPNLESLQISDDDDLYYFLTHPFEWDNRRQQAAYMLADGYTKRETAEAVGVDDRTLYRWQRHPEFEAEKHKLAFLTGATVKAERVIMIKQLIRSKLNDDGILNSRKDILDWIRLLRDEIEPLEFAAIMAGILQSDSTDAE